MKVELLVSDVEEKTKAIIKSFSCGKNAKSRLLSLGIVPGQEILVIKNGRHGPFIIAVKGSRIVLGRGLAHKILVEPQK